LNIALLRASNPENNADVVFVIQKTSLIYSLEFLNQKGKNFITKFQNITRLFADFLIRAGKPMHGIALIKRAITVLRSSNEQVSSLNTQFAMLCLKARCLQHALAIIEHPITSVMHGTNPLEIATYNFYRGMIYLGLERFPEAIECYRKVLSQPVNMPH